MQQHYKKDSWNGVFFQTFQRLTMNDIDQRYLLLTVILSDKEHTMFDRIDLVTIF